MKKHLLVITLLLCNWHPVYAIEEGQSAPACPAQPQAQPAGFKPADYKNKVILIDFWASWCGPCQKAMPFFNGLRNELLKNGFEIVAVNVDEDQEIARQFLQSHPVDYPMFFDPDGECPKTYQVQAMPSSYLIDKTGKVRHIHMGFRDSDQALLREQIQALLAE
jgi:thiol-disulfide isomerase/thioredoxin